MRKITEHQVTGADQLVSLAALDEPGNGGANHRYQIIQTNADLVSTVLNFQNGGAASVGVNGITNEVLIAVVLDRLRGFQSGQFANRDNALAITYFEEGLGRLQRRTRDRIARGVEGQEKA